MSLQTRTHWEQVTAGLVALCQRQQRQIDALEARILALEAGANGS